MAKSKKQPKSRDAYPKLPAALAAKPTVAKAATPSQAHAVRETVESIVIAFVLAFLFRTFEAEAFVIPTGSMAPTLMGRHKDVDCLKCGHRYRISASEEEGDEVQGLRADIAQLKRLLKEKEQKSSHSANDLQEIEAIRQQIEHLQRGIKSFDIVGGVCPVCRYPMPVRPDLPPDVLPSGLRGDIEWQRSYNGDRILVNKYVYTLGEPERWDVVVFKFPGNAQMNYIKRLVGLPNETIRVHQGDLFVGGEGASQDDDFEIARKPADKLLAMRQLVHDTDYDPTELVEAGWPLRWSGDSTEGGAAGWQVVKSNDDGNVRQRYTVDAGDEETWLRYRHTPPNYNVWRDPAGAAAAVRPQLIMDFNAYNSRIKRGETDETIQDDNTQQRRGLRADLRKLGVHWVGDLMVEADVEVTSDQGDLLLELVEGGRRFTCRIDVSNGQATLSAEGAAEFAPTAKSALDSPGSYRVAFANADDQLLLWIDGNLVEFDVETAYDAGQVFGDRSQIRPNADDLEPVAIGALGAELEVTRLKVWRDIYYIAADWNISRGPLGMISDYDQQLSDEVLAALPSDPTLWDVFARRRSVDFPLSADQFFVMGDNSAESSDARLWKGERARGGEPGGAYLERRLLIGKALCVYWPHSWNRIPGTPIPIPLFPNFADMRLVR